MLLVGEPAVGGQGAAVAQLAIGVVTLVGLGSAIRLGDVDHAAQASGVQQEQQYLKTGSDASIQPVDGSMRY